MANLACFILARKIRLFFLELNPSAQKPVEPQPKVSYAFTRINWNFRMEP